LEFTPDGSSLVVVTHEGIVHAVQLDSVNPQVIRALEQPPGYITVFLGQPVLISHYFHSHQKPEFIVVAAANYSSSSSSFSYMQHEFDKQRWM